MARLALVRKLDPDGWWGFITPRMVIVMPVFQTVAAARTWAVNNGHEVHRAWDFPDEDPGP